MTINKKSARVVINSQCLTNTYCNTQVYLCQYDICADAVHNFGLTQADLPRAAIDDTRTGRRFIMAKGSKLSKNSIEKFWNESLASLVRQGNGD